MLGMLWLWWGLASAAEPVDDAMNALADGRPELAMQRLRQALRDDPEHEVRCLLGRVALRAGKPADAVDVLAAVPEDAACARQAAFVTAEALVALGRTDDAAARYEALGADVLGPDRHAAAADRLEGWAARLRADDDPDQAAAVLAEALQLQVGPDRKLAIARELAALDGTQAVDVLADAIAAAEDDAADDRRLLAPLLPADAGMALLAALPDDAATMRARIAVAARLDLPTRVQLASALAARWPDSPEAHQARLEIGGEAAAAGWVTEAHALLDPVANGSGDDAAQAAWPLASLRARQGADDAEERLEALIRRFPLAGFRQDAEARIGELRLHRARRDVRAGRGADAYDPLLAARPDDAALALEAAWASSGSEQLTRLEEIAARWPWSDAAARALAARVQLDPDGGLVWLEAQARAGRGQADAVLAELKTPSLAIRTPGRQARAPVVEVAVRGIGSLEMRLHRIDLEGYVRAGRGPDDLEDLDVGIIAADRTWTVELPDPGPGRHAVVPVPIPTPGPGLYAVTAATPEEEARTALLVSDIELVARRVGGQLVATALREGRPVAGARLLAVGDRAIEARADRSGLIRTEAPDGSLVVLVQTPGGPAMLALDHASGTSADDLAVTVDLDRPVYRPGDTVRFRAVATSGGEPRRGRWRVQLQGGVVHEVLRPETDARGAVHGELVVPLLSSGTDRDGAGRRVLTLRGTPPGSDTEVELARIPVVDEVPPAHLLRAERTDDGAVFTVVDGLDVPVPGVPVTTWRRGEPTTHLTDAAGRVRLPPQPGGLGDHARATVPTTGLHAAAPAAPSPDPLSLATDDPRLRPGQPGTLRLHGPPGPVTVRVARRSGAREDAEPPSGPEHFPSEPTVAYTTQSERLVDGAISTTVHTLEVTLGDDPVDVDLPGLQAGDYVVHAVAADGRTSATSLPLEVRDGLTVTVAGSPKVGAVAPIRVDGGTALVTVEAGRLLEAAIVQPGQTFSPRTDRRWHGDVRVVATSPDDRHTARLQLDARLDVSLTATVDGDQWVLEAVVTDAAGNPTDAEVLLRGLDARLIAEAGMPRTLSLAPFLLPPDGPVRAAVARTLTGASLATPVAAALREESRRQDEARRAKKAELGHLADNAARELLGAAAPLESSGHGFGGLGTTGYGSGGGGMASHRVGVRGGHAQAMGAGSMALRGHREAAVWHLAATDRNGRVRIVVPAPAEVTSWQIDAVALGRGTIGRDHTTIEPPDRPRLVLDPVAPGWPGDEARPRARVIAPSAGADLVLTVDDEAHPLRLGPGEVGVVSLPATRPGETRQLVLREGDRTHERRSWTWALAPGVADPGGSVHAALVGRPGGTPLGALALQPDPAALSDAGRAAVAGRAALAAWPHLGGDEATVARAVVAAAVGAVRESPPVDATGAAQGMLLVAEAAVALGLPRSVIEEAVEAAAHLEPSTPRQRLELTWARAVATGSADEATVGRLVRDAALLDDDGRALLTRLLRRIGERATVDGPTGSGPHAVLAGRSRGASPVDPAELLRHAPPPLGDPVLPDWIEATAPLLARPHPAAAGDGVVRGGVAPQGALIWREAVPGADATPPSEPVLARVPSALDGRAAHLPDPPVCGSSKAPCRIAVGDALALRRAEGGSTAGGLQLWKGHLLGAVAGRFQLAGLTDPEGAPLPPLTVEVADGGDGLTPFGEAGLVLLADQALAGDDDPRPWLTARERLEDWGHRHRARVAQLRFQGADLRGDGAERVVAFENLRDEAPSTPIDLDAVARTARAYREIGRPDRALTLWRRAIGQGFLAEARAATTLEPVLGPLAALTVLREAVARYPAVPLVEQAAFALPDRLLDLADDLPHDARERGVTPTDVRLMAAAWDREFVALHPESPLAPEAGLRLATGLLGLGARDAALQWTQRLLAAHPDHALVDRWMLLSALIETDLGRSGPARRALLRIADEELPQGGGQLGPSALRDDARFALGRLAEASDDPDGARDWYRQLAGSMPEARLSLTALQSVRLDVQPVVRLTPGQPARLEVEVANVGEVHVSAFAVDLRTLFLRESGLPRPDDLRVEGLAPVWTGTRRLGAGAFPSTQAVPLPLSGPGAWLVRLDADGASAATLIVRSGLQLATTDADRRQVTLRFAGKPATGVEVRALAGGRIIAAESDSRGVVTVPAGAPVLARHGAHHAFTEDARADVASTGYAPPSPAPTGDVLQERMKARETQRRRATRSQYDFIGDEVHDSIDAKDLL